MIIYNFRNENVLIGPDVRVKNFFHFLIDRTNRLCIYKLNGFIMFDLGLIFMQVALNKFSF
jgi:hypothetical protein